MTRELNVRITLSECEGSAVSDESYEDIIRDAILAATMDYQVCVEVHTVTPESANPKEGDCKYRRRDCCSNMLTISITCPHDTNEQARKCKYYEPQREEK